MQRISIERERERRKKPSNYTGSFHKPEVVLSPCTSKESSLKSIFDYNCSLLKLTRDFKLLKHNWKRFRMLKNKIKRLPMLKHNCKILLFKQNYKENCLRLNTWYTISGVHNTNQACTIVLFQRSPKNKHSIPSNSSKLVVASGFYSSAMLGVIITAFDKNLKLQVFQLLMIFRTSDDVSFWWTTFEEVLLMMSASGDLQNLLSSERLFFWCFLATQDSIL